MSAKQKTLLHPAPEARDQVLATVRSSAVPLTGSDVKKQLAASPPLAPREIALILEDLAAAGVLRALSPKSAKGKPRYWDRDPVEVSQAAALETVQRAQVPLTAQQVRRQAAAPIKLTEIEWAEILDRHVSEENLHAIPPATAKGKPRYWGHDALEFGRLEILKALEAKGPQAEPQLRKALRGFTDGQFRQIRDAALAAREIWRHPAIGKIKKELFARQPASPEPYLRDVGQQLSKIVPELLAADFSQDAVRRTLVQLIEATGVRFAAERPRADAAPPQDGSVDLIALMRRIEPGADRGALVVSRDLRRVAKLEKQSFDRKVLDLARAGSLSLHRHDFAASLSQAERDDLVTDGAGTYYVGMAIRQKP